MSTAVIEKMEGLANNLTEVFKDENVSMAIGEEGLATIQEHLQAVDKELANPLILGDVKRNTVTSFEEWDERVKGLAEFVRGDAITQFEIQSLTAAEMKECRDKYHAAAPVEPVARHRGDGKADPNDKHYQREMAVYDEEVKKLELLWILWILEKGLLFDIPGKDDAEKLESIGNKIAGDAGKLVNQIVDLSNLTPETLRPF